MYHFSSGKTNNVLVFQSSTALFAESKPSSEWLASIKTVTQTELFQEVANLLEEVFEAIILAGYTPRFLTKYAPDVAFASSAEPDSGLESIPAVESDTQPRG